MSPQGKKLPVSHYILEGSLGAITELDRISNKHHNTANRKQKSKNPENKGQICNAFRGHDSHTILPNSQVFL